MKPANAQRFLLYGQQCADRVQVSKKPHDYMLWANDVSQRCQATDGQHETEPLIRHPLHSAC